MDFEERLRQAVERGTKRGEQQQEASKVLNFSTQKTMRLAQQLYEGVDVKGNGTKGSATGSTGATNAGISFWGNGKIASKIERGANVVISNNAGSGIYTGQKVCNLTIGSATITNNGTGACNVNGTGADMGGGIYNVGTLTLDPSVVLYNNHAAVAGDDLYTSAGHTMTIGAVGTDWILDDCNHAIDSWYDDSADARWCADAASDNHVAPVAPGEQKADEAAVAIKAAHGLILDYAYVGEAPSEAQLPAPMTGLANTASFDTMTDLNRAFKNIHDMMQFTSDNLARSADAYEANEQDAASKLKNV